MAKKRRRFTSEFKREAVRLVLDGEISVAQAARDLDVCETSLHRWVQQHEIDQGPKQAGALTTAEREEIRQLRAQVRRLEMERAILKKATVFFAKENE